VFEYDHSYKMSKVLKKLSGNLVKKPKNLFFIDSIGALLTAVLLSTVLGNLSPYFGMPKTTLTLLSSIAACFCFYSALCFLLLKGKWAFYIRIISFANLLYCGLTFVFVFVHYKELTPLDLTYFLLEIAIICILVYIELTVINKFEKAIRFS